jgi:hypothetical protein
MYILRQQYGDDTPFLYNFDFIYGNYNTKEEAETANETLNIKVYLDNLSNCLIIHDKTTNKFKEIYSDIVVERLKDDVISRTENGLKINKSKIL